MPAADYRVPTAVALLAMLLLGPLLPVPWFQGNPELPAQSGQDRREQHQDMEGITLLMLPSVPAQPATEQPLDPDRIERSQEFEDAEPTPVERKLDWDWSYDPLVPAQAGRPEPVLSGARLRSDLLAMVWSREGTPMDSLQLRLDHYAFLQRSFMLGQRHIWDAEARALWLERHELWLKMYGSDDDWP